MKLTLLLCVLVCCNMLQAKIDKQTIDKMESTAKKIRTAKFFLSDDAIRARIERSMQTEQHKWEQARADYKRVLQHLQDMNVDVSVPDTLDELLMNRVDKDADKILMHLAQQVKQHLHS